MGQVLLLLVVALTVGAVVFGVTVVVTGRDPGLVPVEPDGRAVPLPGGRPLRESDVGTVRFDTAPRGYRMDQVDQALRRAAYDVGYKSELIEVLAAEVAALRDGRTDEAEALRRTREQAVAGAAGPRPAGPDLPPGSALAGGPAAGEPTVTGAAGEPAETRVAGEPAVTGLADEPARAAADEPTTVEVPPRTTLTPEPAGGAEPGTPSEPTAQAAADSRPDPATRPASDARSEPVGRSEPA
ncbi:hypothetical protein AWW66_00885 [Micromonospora rosaria]|uniref:DivIVA domain-containing protein n=1 Tax=Micromonospora rosaria TaxID=47874 RepID=A0A136PZA9_9ACTN|nr:DivIVA domain-containing protein [Micromonospora rosaria]KXK63772.1 hypothetical protein AWW66_00885 [Micromonospora rosaria]